MKHYLILSLIFLLLFLTKWRSLPIYTDEYATIFIAHGLGVDVFQDLRGYALPQYASMTYQQLVQENSLANVIKYNARDGGSGLPHYILAHFISSLVGNKIGVINTLRLLSVVLSLCLVWSFYDFAVRIFDKKIALLSSILLIFLLARYGDYIRTYPLSNLLVSLYFRLFYNIVWAAIECKNISWLSYFLFFVCALLLPFCHFFNSIYLITSVALLMFFLYSFRLHFHIILPSAAILVLCICLFCIYYFSNEAGRLYQATANEYWYYFAQKFGTPENHWLPPATLKYLIIKNIELALITTGLDLRMIAQHWQIRYFGVSLLPMVYALFWLCKFLYRHISSLRLKADIILILISISYIMGYVMFINLLSITFGHTTPLNSSWYSFSLIPLYAICVGFVMKYLSNHFFRIVLYLYIIVVALNATIALWNWEIYSQGSIKDKQLLEKLENREK